MMRYLMQFFAFVFLLKNLNFVCFSMSRLSYHYGTVHLIFLEFYVKYINTSGYGIFIKKCRKKKFGHSFSILYYILHWMSLNLTHEMIKYKIFIYGINCNISACLMYFCFILDGVSCKVYVKITKSHYL